MKENRIYTGAAGKISEIDGPTGFAGNLFHHVKTQTEKAPSKVAWPLQGFQHPDLIMNNLNINEI